MDPVHPAGWNTDQKQLATWSDSDNSSVSSSVCEEDELVISSYGYYKLFQRKQTYKYILEEEELIS